MLRHSPIPPPSADSTRQVRGATLEEEELPPKVEPLPAPTGSAGVFSRKVKPMTKGYSLEAKAARAAREEAAAAEAEVCEDRKLGDRFCFVPFWFSHQ